MESHSDPYLALRSTWDRVVGGGTLTVRYGGPGPFRLSDGDVDLLLRLASFAPEQCKKKDGGREARAAKIERSVQPASCTVVVPCRDEIGNVADLVARLPLIGTHTELIFVDGGSRDGTPDRIDQLIAENPGRDIKLLRQAGSTGKAGATFQGFAAATGDVIMILDADMTVRPEDLPRFFDALTEGLCDVANGTRLVFPMASEAMPGLNHAGNRLFGRYMSWLVGSRVTDTLCGTKAFFRRDIGGILDARYLFGGHDPWGDFELLMSGAYLGLRIMDIPVRYEARAAGESKMRPFGHGLALAQTCVAGARRLKFERRPTSDRAYNG